MTTTTQKRKARALLNKWKNISGVVMNARKLGLASQVNTFLDTYLADTTVQLLHPLLLTWKADNLFREAKFAQAIDEYQGVIRDFPTPIFMDIDFRFAAFKKVSLCYERLGNPARAKKTFYQALKYYPQQEPELRLAAAEVFERSNKIKDARSQYTAIIKSRKKIPNLNESKAYAKRALGRLDLRATRYGRNPTTLAQRIAYCLKKKNIDWLSRMASDTHFSIGHPVGDLSFANFLRTMNQLGKDLHVSNDINVNPYDLHGIGSKRYLRTSGWSGSVFQGDVTFFLTEGYKGWEWTGLLGNIKPETMKRFLSPVIKSSSESKKSSISSSLSNYQPQSIAELGIKAPWPKGRFFRAGGWNKFAEEAVSAAIFPWLAAEYANRDCGWGPCGWYYNEWSHSGDHCYGVDFNSYKRGEAFTEITTGTPVLAVAGGMVKNVVESVPSGHPSANNRVIVDHYTDKELMTAILIAMLTHKPIPRSHYSAQYLHLSGPNEVPVSEGIYIEQGTLLGRMDNTGFSSGPHLHFSMHDNMNNFAGVRPTPMDGQTLLDGEEGKSMHSTNTIVYHDPHYNILHKYSGKYVCGGSKNNGGNVHIWGPVPTGHEERYKFKLIRRLDGYYNILHKYSGKYVCSGSKSNGGNVHIWGPIPNGHEDRYLFELIFVYPCYYYLLHKYSGKYVCTGATNNNGNIHLWGPIPKGHENRYKFEFNYAY